MSLEQFGKDLANVVMPPVLPEDQKEKIEGLWTNLATVITEHVGSAETRTTVYWIAVDYDKVVFNPDTNSLLPDKITAHSWMRYGEEAPFPAPMYWQENDGDWSVNTSTSKEFIIDRNNTNLTIKISRDQDHVADQESIPILNSASNKYTIDVTNQAVLLSGDSSGVVADYSQANSKINLYLGATLVSEDIFLVVPSSVEITYDGIEYISETLVKSGRVLQVTNIQEADKNASIGIFLSSDPEIQSTFNIAKPSDGRDGQSIATTISQITLDYNTIVYNPNDSSYYPNEIICSAWNRSGDSSTPLAVQWQIDDNPWSTEFSPTYSIVVGVGGITADVTVRISVDGGETILDSESIPVLDSSSNAITIDLSNDSSIIKTDVDNEPISYDLAKTTPRVYQGATEQTSALIEISIPVGVVATYDGNAYISGTEVIAGKELAVTDFSSTLNDAAIIIYYSEDHLIRKTFGVSTSQVGATGAPGLDGSDGDQGPPGSNGQTTYFHIAFATSADGSVGFNQSSGPYIGTYVDYVSTDSLVYTAYTWRQFIGNNGEDGSDGLPGVDGTDGKTYYLHLAYANSDDGHTDFSTTIYASKTYIGTLVDELSQDSTDADDYSWMKVEGPQGVQGLPGADGADGSAGADARVVSLTVVKQGFIYDTAGANPTPSTTLVTATALNTTGTVYYDFFKNDVSVGQNTTDNTYSYTPQASYSSMPDKIEVQIRENSNSGAIVARDQITLVGIKAGSSGITSILDNTSHTVPSATNGTVSSYLGSGGTIQIYEGSNLLTFHTSLAVNRFTIGTPVVSPTGKITVGAISGSGTTTATIAVHSAMDIATDLVTITYPVTVRRADGTDITLSLVQTITKSKIGATGAPGTSSWVTYCDNTPYDTPESPPDSGVGGASAWHLALTSLSVWKSTKQSVLINDPLVLWGTPLSMIEPLSYFAPRYIGYEQNAHPDHNPGDWWIIWGAQLTDPIRGIWTQYPTESTPRNMSVTPDIPTTSMISGCWSDLLLLTNQAGHGAMGEYLGTTIPFTTSLASNAGFFGTLMTQELFIHAAEGKTGVIYGGDRWNADGTDKTSTSTGFWLGTNGTFKAKDGVFSGELTSTVGTIGGFKLKDGALYTGSKTLYNDNLAGVHVGTDGLGLGENFTVDVSGNVIAKRIKAMLQECSIDNVSAGNNIVKEDIALTEFDTRNSAINTWIKLKSLQICASGSVKVTFNARAETAGGTRKACLFLGDNPVSGTEVTLSDTATSTVTKTLTGFVSGQIISVGVYSSIPTDVYEGRYWNPVYGFYVDYTVVTHPLWASNFIISISENVGILPYLGNGADTGTVGAAPTIAVSNDDTSDITQHIVFSSAISGIATIKTDSTLTFNPYTNTLSSTIFSGTLFSGTSFSGTSASFGGVSIPEVYTNTQDPTGFLDRTAILSFADASRTFTITGAHDIYINGVKTSKTTASIQIANTTGLHFIYYNTSGVLTESTAFPGMFIPLVVFVYWNATTVKGILTDERHGIQMNGKTHDYLHKTVGARYESGFGATFTDTTLSLAPGVIWDEDLRFALSAQTTCKVLYKNGTGDWVWDANASSVTKIVSTNLQYNSGNTLTACGNNDYVAYWVCATNDVTNPIISIIGQNSSGTIATARSVNIFNSLALGSLPYLEIKLLYRVIYKNTSTTPTYVELEDYRTVSSLPGSISTVTIHNTLLGLQGGIAGAYYHSNQPINTTDNVTFANLTLTGDFTVNGTVTTINSTTLTVDDKNIELGSVAIPSDITADGGGITLKGATDKTIIWDNANDNWTLNQDVNIPTGKVFKINNVSVLSATTLGSSVVGSSLTSVGTLTGLTIGDAAAPTLILKRAAATLPNGWIKISGDSSGSEVFSAAIQAYDGEFRFYTQTPSTTNNLTAKLVISVAGAITTGVWQATAITDTYLATISTAGKVANSATTATSANTASAIVARDGSGDFSVHNITAFGSIIIANHTLSEYTIPGSTDKILQLKNIATGQTSGDVFSIFEIRSPDTANTESTLSQHNVVSGSDDWVRDVSFHNYATTMKAVDVISHFTGTTAGLWDWVSRYTTGTNYDMIERTLLRLEGDTGNLRLGEDSTLVSASRGKLDVRNKGYTAILPSILASVDSSYGTQPPALKVQDGTNYAMAGSLTLIKMLNTGDSGTLLKLENAGTGNYITADSVFSVSKAGSVGVGTASPTYKLDVREAKTVSIENDYMLAITNTATAVTDTAIFGLRTNQGEATRERASLVAGLDSISGGYLAFATRLSGTGMTEKMRILGSGNVGIGTTNPSGDLLEVYGSNASIKVNSSNNAELRINRASTNYRAITNYMTGGVLSWAVGTTDSDVIGDGTDFSIATGLTLTGIKMLIQSSTGNVGIGTTSPGEKLEIAGNFKQTGAYSLYNTFTSGSLGTGWKLDYNSSVSGKSYLEVDNLLVRDTIRTHIFQKDVIKATNGQLYVSDSGVIADDYSEDGTINFDIDKSASFNVNDILIAKDWNTTSNTITSCSFQITTIGASVNGKQTYSIATVSGSRSTLQKGMTAVRTSGGNILIDASTANSPFIDVLSAGVTKARLGNLTGIAGCSGYGLYSDNVFLNGKIMATSGSIGGFTIGTYLNTGSKATYADDLAGVHIGSDGIGLGSTFKVSAAGVLTASSVDLTGKITATSGAIGGSTNGWEISAGIITAIGTGVIKTHATSGKGIEINSTAIKSFSIATSPVQTAEINTDGSGWFGLIGTKAITWTTAGIVNISGWTASTTDIRKDIDTGRKLFVATTSPADASFIDAGFTLFRDDADMGSVDGLTKIVTIGRLRTLNTNTFSNDYGIEIIKNLSTNAKHLLRVGGTVALIAGWNFDEGKIYSTGWSGGSDGVATTTGLMIHSTGYISAPKFSLSSTGVIKATDVDLTGKITATSGAVGGWTLGASSLYNLRTTFLSATAGVYIGTDGIALGTAVASAEFSVTSSGVLTAKSGTVGGWTINDTEGLYAGITTDHIHIKAGEGFWAGATALVDAPFSVTKNGELKVSNAIISGTVISNYGIIGPFNIATHLNTGDKQSYNDGVTGLHLGVDGIGVSSKFIVDSTGVLIATDADITGIIHATSGTFTGRIEATSGYFRGVIETSEGFYGGSIIHNSLQTQDVTSGGTLTIPAVGTNPPFKYWNIHTLRDQITALGGITYYCTGSWMGITPTRIGGSGTIQPIWMRQSVSGDVTLNSQSFNLYENFNFNLYGIVRLQFHVGRESLGSNTVGQLRIEVNGSIISEPTWNMTNGYISVDISGSGYTNVKVYARIYSWGVFHYYAYLYTGDFAILGFQYITNSPGSVTSLTDPRSLMYSFWGQPNYINIATHYGSITGSLTFTASASYYTGADLITYLIPSTIRRYVEYDCSMTGGLAGYTSFILGANLLRFRTVLGTDSGNDLIIWEDSTMYTVTGVITLPDIPARVKIKTLEPLSTSEDIGLAETGKAFRNLYLSGNSYIEGVAFVKILRPADTGAGCQFRLPLIAPSSLDDGSIWIA